MMYFVKLTSHKGEMIIVNPRHIVLMKEATSEHPSGLTVITLSNEKELVVLEDIDQIINASEGVL